MHGRFPDIKATLAQLRFHPVDLGLRGAVTGRRRRDLEPLAGRGQRVEVGTAHRLHAVVLGGQAGPVSVSSSSVRSRRRSASSRSIGLGGGALRRDSLSHWAPRHAPISAYPATGISTSASTTSTQITRPVSAGWNGKSKRQPGERRLWATLDRRQMDENGGAQRWWHGAVLYQLYVRSWLDTNGDGYGDLPGIIARLDYLSWLGVDGIWLSPTMPSPDQDWGYDVSDYLRVHPELGTLEDLDRLIAEAGARGLRVLLDLVPNHTSTAHPWFADAATGRDAEFRDYYMWADPAPGGGPPNNWINATGQSAWAWHEPTGQYYLHLFLDSQADLNWREPAVHREFDEIVRFWFDRGVAGFRIDVAHGLYKDAKLRDNPPATSSDPLGGRFGQEQKYSANRPETHGVFRDWRKIAESYQPPRLLLGETWVRDLASLAGYHGEDDELQLAFNFPFVFAGFAAQDLSGIVGATLAHLPAGASPVWTASNHDVGRFPTRWCGGDERKVRLALLVLATLPGTTVLYYGDEIGMTDVRVPVELRRDHMSRQGAAGMAAGTGAGRRCSGTRRRRPASPPTA